MLNYMQSLAWITLSSNLAIHVLPNENSSPRFLEAWPPTHQTLFQPRRHNTRPLTLLAPGLNYSTMGCYTVVGRNHAFLQQSWNRVNRVKISWPGDPNEVVTRWLAAWSPTHPLSSNWECSKHTLQNSQHTPSQFINYIPGLRDQAFY